MSRGKRGKKEFVAYSINVKACGQAHSEGCKKRKTKRCRNTFPLSEEREDAR